MKRGFGWGSWAQAWKIFSAMWRKPEPIPGYDLLPIASPPWWRWPKIIIVRAYWTMKGPQGGSK